MENRSSLSCPATCLSNLTSVILSVMEEAIAKGGKGCTKGKFSFCTGFFLHAILTSHVASARSTKRATRTRGYHLTKDTQQDVSFRCPAEYRRHPGITTVSSVILPISLDHALLV